MPIRGRNAGSSDLNLKQGLIVAQGTTDTVTANAPLINIGVGGGFAQRWAFDMGARCDVAVKEVGVTISGTGGGGGGDTDIVFYAGSTPIASAAFNAASAAGTEFTTRDGTLSWAAGYEGALDRVFAKGTVIQVGIGGNGHTGASFIVYAVTNEAGSGPAN